MTPTTPEPVWLGALRMTALNPLMCDQQCVPIINEGTYAAVAQYIDALTAERDELLSAVERVRNLPGYLMFGQEDSPANVCLLAADILIALGPAPTPTPTPTEEGG